MENKAARWRMELEERKQDEREDALVDGEDGDIDILKGQAILARFLPEPVKNLV